MKWKSPLDPAKYSYTVEPCTCPTGVDDVSFRPEKVIETDLELLKLAANHFRDNIASHFTQATLFAAIQAAFISFFSTAVGPTDQAKTALVDARSEAGIIAFGGLLFSLLWLVMAWRREHYIRLWRDVVVHLDRAVDRHHAYLDLEKVARHDAWNPTGLAIWVPAVLAFAWFAAILYLFGSSHV